GPMSRRLAAVVLLAAALSPTVLARVISYAPYTDRLSVPAFGHLLNRHFALVETSVTPFMGMRGQVVLYDSKGEEEPRVIFPQEGSEAVYDGVAVVDHGDDPPLILAVTIAAS